MSYTMTIESPEKAAWFERERASMTPAELGELFLAFLAERVARRRNDDLAALAGSWVDDPAMEKSFADMDKVDEALWK